MPPKKPRLPDGGHRRLRDLDRRWARRRPRSRNPAGPGDRRDDARRHWAFQPVGSRRIPPASRDAVRVQNPVDAFVLARLEERGWTPAPPASRAEWIRRVTFDLTGLPPTPEEVEAFVRDAAADADERLVDRLLASPRYGERWAQHWLDVVRYAETEGYEYDRHVPDAWRFRDYVIDALNRDKPFDRFLTEQIAGDEIAPDDPECLTASIFHRLGPVRRNAGNPEIALSRNEVLTERTDIIGSAFLGLTVGCARCHNHKLEPISQKDYYRLQAYLAATEEHNIILAPEAEHRQLGGEDQDAQGRDRSGSRSRCERASGARTEAAGGGDRGARRRACPPPLPTIPATRNDFAQRTEIHVLQRGDLGEQGRAGRPAAAERPGARDQPELPADVRRPAHALARWLASPGASADGAGDRQPALAAPLRRRDW